MVIEYLKNFLFLKVFLLKIRPENIIFICVQGYYD